MQIDPDSDYSISASQEESLLKENSEIRSVASVVVPVSAPQKSFRIPKTSQPRPVVFSSPLNRSTSTSLPRANWRSETRVVKASGRQFQSGASARSWFPRRSFTDSRPYGGSNQRHFRSQTSSAVKPSGARISPFERLEERKSEPVAAVPELSKPSVESDRLLAAVLSLASRPVNITVNCGPSRRNRPGRKERELSKKSDEEQRG